MAIINHDEVSEPGDRPAAPEVTLASNRTDINRHLHALFQPAFAQAHPAGLVEIAWTDAASDGGINKAKQFSVFALEAAADFAEQQSRKGFNVYVGPALRKAGTR